MNTPANKPTGIADVTDLLLLQQRLRNCHSLNELGYLVSNETAKLFAYRTAFVWLGDRTGGRLLSVSGLPFSSEHSPFGTWTQVFGRSMAAQACEKPVVVHPGMLPQDVASAWSDYLPANVLWLPLLHNGICLGGVVLARDECWREEEMALLSYWVEAVAHALHALHKRSPARLNRRHLLQRKFLLAGVAAVFLLMWFPLSLSVLAPVEVLARNPVIVRSPINGVIGEVMVTPNQNVAAGDILLALDDTALRSRIDVARQELAIASAEYRRADQASVTDRATSAQLPMLKARVEQAEAQLAYENSLLERAVITAQSAGVVILPRVDELEGMPVEIGQKILTLADPQDMELELWIAVGDSIPLPEAAPVRAFLNVDPQHAYEATLDYVNYQAEVSPDGIFGFRARASLSGDEALRIGWRGTAKIRGERVSLFYFLFRRPIAGVRQWLGI